MIPRESEDLSSSDATTTESDSDDTREETSNWYHWEYKDFYIFVFLWTQFQNKKNYVSSSSQNFG